MEQIIDNNGLKLIKKYDRYYIRFIGGKAGDMIYDLHITDDEASVIIATPDSMNDICNDYLEKEEYSEHFFVDSMISDYMTFERKMSEKRIELNMQKLNRHPDIKQELYSTIAGGKFPSVKAITVCGYTAKQLEETTRLNVLGAYNYLIYLREDERNALDDLKKGLPVK